MSVGLATKPQVWDNVRVLYPKVPRPMFVTVGLGQDGLVKLHFRRIHWKTRGLRLEENLPEGHFREKLTF